MSGEKPRSGLENALAARPFRAHLIMRDIPGPGKGASPDLPTNARQVVNAAGLLVLPGLIDIHTHIFTGEAALGLPSDQIGVYQGATTVVNVGSSGAGNLALFREKVAASAARVLAFLNIAHRRHCGGKCGPDC
jgi:predicted amidohydrolase